MNKFKSTGARVDFPAVSGIRRITDSRREYFVANYYGINPFSASQKYVVVLSTTVRNYLPGINDPATIGLLETDTLKIVPISDTRAWNFQEGCMAHWIGTAPDSEIIFNDFTESRYVARIINIHSCRERIICRPVSAVAPDGKKAVSLNYSRRRLTRPDYGYDGMGEDPRADVPFPEDDGLFLLDLEENTQRLIVPVAEIRKLIGIPDDVSRNALMWFAHTLFNRDASRIFFLARIIGKEKRHTAALTTDIEGKDLKPCFPSLWEWGGSHYDWYSNNMLMVTAMFEGRKYSPVLFTDGGNDYRILGKGLFGDGHGTFSPCGKYMAIDTYPDPLDMQNLYLLDMATDAVLPIGRFFRSPEFCGYWRCDLHPHWSPRGDILLINSTHHNIRQIHMINMT